MTDKEPDALPPSLELQPNPSLGILRFFVWLTPSGISVACLFLGAWTETKATGAGILALVLGILGWLACAWFDSKLALPCRRRQRSLKAHIFLFINLQVAIVPAVLFASFCAICVTNPW